VCCETEEKRLRRRQNDSEKWGRSARRFDLLPFNRKAKKIQSAITKPNEDRFYRFFVFHFSFQQSSKAIADFRLEAFLFATQPADNQYANE
jgi:hypothetical protein